MTRKGLARTDGARNEGRTSRATTNEITVTRMPDARINMVVHSPPMATSKRRPACKKVTTRRVESIRTTRISPICSPTVRISVRPPTLTITTDRMSPTIPVIAIPAPGNPGTLCPGRGGGGSCPGNGGGGSVWPGPGGVNKGMNGSGRPVGPEGTTASFGGLGVGGTGAPGAGGEGGGWGAGVAAGPEGAAGGVRVTGARAPPPNDRTTRYIATTSNTPTNAYWIRGFF